MNEELKTLQRRIEKLEEFIVSLQRSSTIPLAIDQALKERLKSKILSTKATLNFGEIAAGTSAILTVSLGGVKVNDPTLVSAEDALATGIFFTGYVTTADIVTVRCDNFSAGAVNPASAEFKIVVFT